MIRFLCAAVCQGCRKPVNVWDHHGYTVVRDRSASWSPLHLCADPEQRERIELPIFELMAYQCWQCGSKDVAPSSWGRVVDFPCSDIEVVGWAEGWVGAMQEHVCAQQNTNRTTGEQAPGPAIHGVEVLEL